MTRKILLAAVALLPLLAAAQDAESRIPEPSDTTFLTLDQALEIALSENVAVKVADKEIERSGYAKKGTYAALFPQINASGSFQRTIKKQIMYMDQDDSGEGGGGGFFGSIAPYFMRIQELSVLQGLDPVTVAPSTGSSSEGFAVGRWNAWSTGISANMPLVNAQLWKSIEISGQQVELAVEQARSSRLDMVTQVKQAFYAVLLAKEALSVYRVSMTIPCRIWRRPKSGTMPRRLRNWNLPGRKPPLPIPSRMFSMLKAALFSRFGS